MPSAAFQFIYKFICIWNYKLCGFSLCTFLGALGLYLFWEVVAFPNLIGLFPANEAKLLTARTSVNALLVRIATAGVIGLLATGAFLLMLSVVQMLFFRHTH